MTNPTDSPTIPNSGDNSILVQQVTKAREDRFRAALQKAMQKVDWTNFQINLITDPKVRGISNPRSAYYGGRLPKFTGQVLEPAPREPHGLTRRIEYPGDGDS
jgi:hypothetical protein